MHCRVVIVWGQWFMETLTHATQHERLKRTVYTLNKRAIRLLWGLPKRRSTQHNDQTGRVTCFFFFIVGMDPWMLIKVLGYGWDPIPSLLLRNKSSTSSLSLCLNCVNSLSIKVPVRRKQGWDGGRCLGSKEQQVVPGPRSLWLATTEETH